jgi:hypothetical protein
MRVIQRARSEPAAIMRPCTVWMYSTLDFWRLVRIGENKVLSVQSMQVLTLFTTFLHFNSSAFS